ncbi:sensor histidine kinase [Adlercreutzia murintestinalis]|uniref:sensor histidine kinase n=1 Tax=Adlercreutzia murintestinalis TaxID=2941325 RepID=UPI00203A8F06|nr:histidine kinase [Adlercreutzia murintestinalis]
MPDAQKHGREQRASLTGIDWGVDVIIALGAFGFGLLQMSMSANLMIPDDFIRRVLGIRAITLSAWGMAAVALTCAPLVVRRRFPWVAFAACAVFWTFFESQMGVATLSLLGPLIALFTVAYERPRGEALGACALMAALIVLCSFSAETGSLAMLMLVQNVAITVAVALAGYALHARAEVVAAAEARADAAERTRDAEAQRRVEEERLRIAREVHDITAHSLSAVSVQAAAASALVDTDPQAAKEALASIRGTAKDALDEMRGVIGVLRAGAPEEAETQPVLGLDHMDQLVTYLEQAGVACELREQVSPKVHVPTYVSTALFSVAREAATNIVRHAGAHQASISLVVRPGSAEIAVSDDGCGLSTGQSEGHGIEGMRERVTVLGGIFDIRTYHEGETRVVARIPLSSGDAPTLNAQR